MTDVTRRKLLGVAAGTMASAVGTGLPEPAAADDAADLALFVKVSGSLTGIDTGRLAPTVDPIEVKRDIFDRAKRDPSFAGLMQIARTNPDPAAAAAAIMADPIIRFLGRSIILAWYLGAWYEPTLLAQSAPPFPMQHQVISPAAYTQAWTWRVAQAHPMGYSDLRFGYWSDDPLPLDDFIKG
jgi:Membrane bound FAD containing D-sorbitol dehydrogenase